MALTNTLDKTLFIFVDESGNFDFSEKGSAYFVVAAVAALSPIYSAAKMHQLRYELLANGHNLSSFHASEDKQFVRDSVFNALTSLKDVKAHVIYGKKDLTFDHLKNREEFYLLFARAIIKYMIKVYASEEFEQVVIVLDQVIPKKKQGLFKQSVKPQLKLLNKPFHIYFHPMNTDSNGQIADYVAWSKFIDLTRNENRPWTALKDSINPSEFNIFHASEV